MNILLTGATGFVGKQLTISLLKSGYSVYAIARDQKKADNLLSSIPSNIRKNLTIVEGDITMDKAGISHETINFLKNTIHTVYHVAAFLSFNKNDKEKTFKANLDGTRNILELAKDINVNNFFYVSTAYTLGEMSYAKEELHPINHSFVNYYEESKCYAEHLVFQYKESFNINIFRPSIIIGDSKTGEADTTFALYGVIRGFELLKRRSERKKEDLQKNFKFLCNKDTHQNLVPIDYVITVLTTALLHAKENTIYHIINSNPPKNQLIFDLVSDSLNFKNIELVPTDYIGELSKEEQKFNEPMRVFYKYWDNSIKFDDSNTKQLLLDGKNKPLDLNKDDLKTIISRGNTQYLVTPSVYM